MNFYPAILSDEHSVIEEQIRRAQEASGFETLHLDIIDGIFADNITVTPADLTRFDFQDLQIDLHLMADEPLDLLYEASDYESLPIRAVIGQIERLSYQSDFLKSAKSRGWLAGLALDLYTPLSEISEDSWEMLDVILIMGIEAGFQGRAFDPRSLKKVASVCEKVEKLDLSIEIIVDGGVKLDNIGLISEAGAESVSVGSGFWQTEDLSRTLEQFQQQVIEREHE